MIEFLINNRFLGLEAGVWIGMFGWLLATLFVVYIVIAEDVEYKTTDCND